MSDPSESKPPPLPATTSASSAPPPLPTPALNYFRPSVRLGIGSWTTLTFVQTVGQWHHTRVVLARAHIQCLMGEGEGVADPEGKSFGPGGIALLVPDADLARASAIYQAMKDGRELCPHCGSTDARKLPLPWWWIALAIPFLGVPPYSPPRLECNNCGKRWE